MELPTDVWGEILSCSTWVNFEKEDYLQAYSSNAMFICYHM